jgi:xanthine dehydrogenase YagS FAD-binding subunit
MVRMADAAEHPVVKRDYPVIAQSLALAASQQIRNMASLGGNVLQRTRCTYFRDTSYDACNKRSPGSGCAALDGFNRSHAVLGVSDRCIATYPGDFAQALIALDASVEILGPKGNRTAAFASLHRPPGSTPDIETSLKPGEMIASFGIPAGPCDVTVYLVLNDYRTGLAYVEAAADEADRETIIRNLLSGQYSEALRVVAFNTAEGWSRDRKVPSPRRRVRSCRHLLDVATFALIRLDGSQSLS